MLDKPLPFGPNSIWYSVPASDTDAVLDSFGLTETRKASWKESIVESLVNNLSLFITPPANGWSLVAGRRLACPTRPETRSSVFAQIQLLSRVFGECQFFADIRGVDLYCWIRSIAGEITRAFVFSGELLVDIGDKTEIESVFPWDILNHDLEAEDDDAFWDSEPFPTEDSVLTVAADWSVSPACVHSYDPGPVLLSCPDPSSTWLVRGGA